jgi:hypothetical protein
MNRVQRALLVLAVGAMFSACGSRPAYWDQSAPAPAVATYGLQEGVAVVDSANSRLVFLSALPAQQLSAQQLPVAHNPVTTTVSPDGRSLFILASGDWPVQTAADQLPSLTRVSQSPSSSTTVPAKMTATQFWMSNPLQNLVVDPGEHWAVAYAGAQTNFVQNVSELVLFDLTQAPNPSSPSARLDETRSPNPVSRTIQAFGGIPQQLSFTAALNLGGGLTRHLLLMETNIDVTLVDMDDAFPVPPATAPPETTVRLTNGTDGTMVTPAGLAVYPGDPSGPARLAIRASNDTNVFTLVLGPSTPTINLTDVGGIPSDMAFVMTDAPTDGGLRLAALVPSNSNAVLVEPDTSLTTTVSLDAAYTSLSLVTQALGTPAPTVDVALLWGAPSGATYGVELWTLGNSVGTPYRSVQGVDVSQSIQAVDDVPGNAQLKVLEVTGGSEFVVLNLVTQNAAPLETSQSASLMIAPDGLRMWVFTPQGTNLASIDFKDLNPVRLTTDLPINAVYDVSRVDSTPADPQRSLVAIHQLGTLGATVFDALNPSPITSRRADALLLEGP